MIESTPTFDKQFGVIVSFMTIIFHHCTELFSLFTSPCMLYKAFFKIDMQFAHVSKCKNTAISVWFSVNMLLLPCNH